MSKYFDSEVWDKILLRPLWYIELLPEYERLKILMQKSDESERDKIKAEVYGYIENKLNNDEIFLAKTGPNLDEERKEIDTIVIHHTSHEPGMTWQKLSAIHLLRLYSGIEGRKEQQEKIRSEKRPIYSNHFRNGKQVFYAYHWLVRKDGTLERLLEDDQIGWQAGNWDVNTRSIAICIDGDLHKSSPNMKVIKSISDLIEQRYTKVPKDRIFGHREINPNTDCPGDLFLGGWKKEIIDGIFEIV